MASAGLALAASATGAHAQAAPANVVSACTGVSLPASTIRDLLLPVVSGIVTPVQGVVNPILTGVGGLLGIPALSLDAAGIVNQAANGQDITLQALDVNGNILSPTAACQSTSDVISLTDPAGIAIGGNKITGLGANGAEATAGEINSIAFGNRAATAASAAGAIAIGTDSSVGANATGSVALGRGAQATAANSVAIGAGSVAARGPQLAYAALGLAGPQNSAGELSVGSATGARQITNVAAGSAATDAVNVAQLAGVDARIDTVDALSVKYDGASRQLVTFAGAGGTTLRNVAAGTVSATSSDAVNGAQLFATNQSVTNVTNNVNNGAVGPVRYSNTATPTTPNGGTITNNVTLVGAAAGTPVGLHNVAAGTVAATSTDAVNGAQLFATNQAVTNNTTAITNLSTDVTNVRNDVTTIRSNVTNIQNDVTDIRGDVTNVQTDVTNIRTDVTNVRTDVTNLTNNVNNGAVGPVRYSDSATPTTPNGGVPSNDLTLVGAAAAPVGLHNVAAGAIAPGSTDAVNGSQIYAIGQNAVNAVTYDTDANGVRSNRITLSGGDAAAPVAITNVAPATLSAASTDAVNGSQLYATNQVANTALSLGQNSIQYDDSSHGVATLGGPGAAAPVALRNVAAGTAATDAVNVAQMNSGLDNAVTTANNYTDSRLANLGFDLTKIRRDNHGGTAAALAAAGLPQAYVAGKGMIAIAGGTYGSQNAVAFGFSKAFSDGHTVVKASATYNTRGMAGGNAGVGYQF